MNFRVHVSPLSLAVDGSSRAICSASSDRESSTGRALRRDMDSLRLIIFILSIFSPPPLGPTGLRRRSKTASTSWLSTFSLMNLATFIIFTVQRNCYSGVPCAFSKVLWAPNYCVCSHTVSSHCYVSQVQTLQNKRQRMRDRQTQRERERTRGKENKQKCTPQKNHVNGWLCSSPEILDNRSLPRWVVIDKHRHAQFPQLVGGGPLQTNSDMLKTKIKAN